MISDTELIRAALDAAAAAGPLDVPIGAVVFDSAGIELARAANAREALGDPTAHAEILALRSAAVAHGDGWRLEGATLAVTVEPCTMCAAAISFARIRRLYYGAGDPKGGAVENGVRFFAQPSCHHAPDVYSGLGEREAADILTGFFRSRRD